MRHVNAIVYGLFPRPPGRVDAFHKQIGFHDFYFGHPDGDGPAGKLGALQQIHSPPVALVKHHLPRGVGALLSPLARRMTGLLAIGEDQPNDGNRVRLSTTAVDRFGLPQLEITHRYSARDLSVIKVLIRQAKRILGEAGASVCYTHDVRTFSHALGTLRMGTSAEAAPVDPLGRFRGLDNLLVTDGSVFPTSAAVSPSLTIAALALRAADTAVRQGWA
jgi:choline dehydrogenase-like flavoprotein